MVLLLTLLLPLTKLLLGTIIIVLEHLPIFNLSFMGMFELVTIVQQHTFQMLKQLILCHDVNSYGLCICHISH
jgi:hypothetical protein